MQIALGITLSAAKSGATGGGGGTYHASAVHFDGGTTLWTSALTGGVASYTGTFFQWYKAGTSANILSTLANFAAGGTQPGGVLPDTSGTAFANFYLFNNAPQNGRYIFQVNDGVKDFGVYADQNTETDTWQLVAFTWNTNADAGSRTYHIMQNGTLQTVTIWWEDGGPVHQDWSAPVFVIGSDGWQFNGSVWSLAEPFVGDFSDLYLNVTQAVDLSDPAVIAKIISGGKPVDQGADGSLLTGSRPLLYLSGDASSYGANKGYGGSFATFGTLTNATTSPSD